MKDPARRANKLRRRVYRETPVASTNRTAELDHRMGYAEMAGLLAKGHFGVSSTGAAVALWRACRERGIRAWCYRFGFSEDLTWTVTIIEADGVPQIHDAYLNVSYSAGLYEVLAALRNGESVMARCERRDRKVYIMDPAREPVATARWLEEHADRELQPVDGLRRFELLWNRESLHAIDSAIEPALHEAAAHGHPADLQFAMLHPIAVFDGEQWHRERTEMPLLSGTELGSPVAASRVALRDLADERARVAEKAEAAAKLEAELGDAKAQILAASRRFAAERETWLQQKASLHAAKTAAKGELAELQAKLSSAIDLRAQRDSQIAQLRAEIEDSGQQFQVHQDAVEVERRAWEAARLQLETKIRGLRARLDADSREREELRDRSAVLESRAEAADQQTIEIAEYFPPLVDEISRLRLERDTIAHDRAVLAAQIAASPWARLRSFWRRLARRPRQTE